MGTLVPISGFKALFTCNVCVFVRCQEYLQYQQQVMVFTLKVCVFKY